MVLFPFKALFYGLNVKLTFGALYNVVKFVLIWGWMLYVWFDYLLGSIFLGGYYFCY